MTTTTTTWTSQILTEAIGLAAIPAHTGDKQVMLPLCNQKNMDGAATLTDQIAVDTDLGPSPGIAEGVAAVEVDLTKGTPIQVTPTEFGQVHNITDRALRRRVPGMTSDQVWDVFRNNDLAGMVAMLGPDANRATKMLLEAQELAVTGTIPAMTNTVGTTGTANSVTNMISALFQHKILEPDHDERCYVLTEKGWNDIRLELGVTGGAGAGLEGSVWFQQGDLSVFNDRPDLSRNGYTGTFMGVPSYAMTESVKQTSGGDEFGVLMSRGEGVPDEPDSLVGAVYYVEGHSILFDVDKILRQRSLDLLAKDEHAAALLDDDKAIRFIYVS